MNVKVDVEALKTECPHIVVGTPDGIMDLATSRKAMDLSKVKHFIMDEQNTVCLPSGHAQGCTDRVPYDTCGEASYDVLGHPR